MTTTAQSTSQPRTFKTGRPKEEPKEKMALLIVDAPNLNRMVAESMTPPGCETIGRVPRRYEPDLVALQKWWYGINKRALMIVYTNMPPGQKRKESWVRYLRRSGVIVRSRPQVERTRVRDGVKIKTDIDSWMTNDIGRYHKKYDLVKVVVLSHDARRFGGDLRQFDRHINPPFKRGVFDRIMRENGVECAYMGFGGLHNRPHPAFLVGYIDVQEVPDFLPYDFLRYDVAIVPSEAQQSEEQDQIVSTPRPNQGRNSWFRRLIPRPWRTI